MKKLITLLLISNFAFGQTAKLDTNSILIGEHTTFNISNTISETEVWPTYAEFLVEGVEIIKEGKLDTVNNIISQNFIITAWDSGSYYIPPISFSENSKTEGLLLNVQTITLEEGAELKDIKQPMEAPIGWSDIWPWLVSILLFALIVFLLKKYIFNKKEYVKIEKPKVIIPADVIALKELNKLEKAEMWQEGDVKKYHTKLSEIIRRYTENRFKFIALELPTDDIIRLLAYHQAKENNFLDNNGKLKKLLGVDKNKNLQIVKGLNNLEILLQRADLVKFAKSKPIDSENIESMQLAKEFIFSTKENKENE